MSQFIARQSSILHSRAGLLILPLPADGVVLGSVLTRLMVNYPCVYQSYRELANKGKLSVGDVLIKTVQKEVTGLGVGTPKTASYIAIVIAHHHATDPIRLSTLTSAYQTLQPQLFELMRSKSLRLVALYHAFSLFGEVALTTAWQSLKLHLDVSRISVEVYFDKRIEFPILDDLNAP